VRLIGGASPLIVLKPGSESRLQAAGRKEMKVDETEPPEGGTPNAERGLGKYDLAISHPLLSEYEEVVARLATRYPMKQPTDWLSAIRQAGHLYLPAPLAASTADPDDEMFIECAVTARADYLVTGDKGHLLALKQAGGIPIVAASEFLPLLGLPENPA
jgi:uncharacterized protein